MSIFSLYKDPTEDPQDNFNEYFNKMYSKPEFEKFQQILENIFYKNFLSNKTINDENERIIIFHINLV